MVLVSDNKFVLQIKNYPRHEIFVLVHNEKHVQIRDSEKYWDEVKSLTAALR